MHIIYNSQVAIILLFIFATILFLLPQKKKNRELHHYIYLFFYIALVVIAVTRPENTADTDNYTAAFRTGMASSRLEPMYFLIVQFARWFPFPVVVGFTIYALLSITPRFFYINKQSINIWASLMVYMSYCYIAQDIIAIRSAVASAILLLVIWFRLQNKIKYMIAAILVATLFHYTALVFFAIMIIKPNKNNRLFYIALLVGSYFLYFLEFDIRTVFPILNYLSFLEYNLTDYYNSTAEVYGTLNGPQILRLTTCVFFWIFVNKIKATNPYALTYLKVFTISLCMFPIFSSVATMGYRLYEIFASAEAIGLPILFMGVFRRKVYNRAAIMIYTFYFFYVSITSSAYWDPS